MIRGKREILQNGKFLIRFNQNEFTVFHKSSLEKHFKFQLEDITSYFLHDLFFFISTKNSFYALDLDKREITDINDNIKKPFDIENLPEMAQTLKKATAIFALDNFLYLGFNSGIIHKFTFNAALFRKVNIYNHHCGISKIVSDNALIFATDAASNKLLVIKNENEIVKYEILNPRIFFNQVPFLAFENVLFALNNISISDGTNLL